MRKRVLFVNDTAKAQNLQGLLENMKEFWDIQFVTAESDIWNSLANGNFDVLIYDLTTPEINGIELLQEISQRYPQLVRIIIAGPSDQELVLKRSASTIK